MSVRRIEKPEPRLDTFKPLSYTPLGSRAHGKPGYFDYTWPIHSGTPGDGELLPEPLEPARQSQRACSLWRAREQWAPHH